MTTKRELLKRVAELESVNDQLVTEITYVDHLMREVGFTNGLETIKSTACDMVEEGQSEGEYE
jgi:hypothetical protein